MQPNWLREQRQQQLVTFTTSVTSGLLFVLLGVLLNGLIYGLSGRLISELGDDLLRRLSTGQLYALPSKPPDGLFSGLVGLLVGGLLGGLSVGMRYPLVGGLVFGLVDGLRYRLLYGYSWLVYGLISGLVALVSIMLVGYSQEIKTVEKIRWSWAAVRSKWIWKLLKRLGLGLVFGLLHGLVNWLSIELPDGANTEALLVFSLVFALVYGLVFGLIFGLVFVLVGVLKDGLTVSEIKSPAFSNEGIRRSGHNAFICGLGISLVFALVIGLLYGLGYGLGYGLDSGLVFLSFYGLLIGFMFGLRFGGHAYLHHFALRLVLWHNNFAPLRYVRFLDYAVARIFLYKVGGGYAFVHRLVLEHFAALYQPSVEQHK